MLRRPVALSIVEALYKSTMPKRKAKGEFFKPKKAKVEEESKGLEGSAEVESSKENGLREDENERSWKILSKKVTRLYYGKSADILFLSEIKCNEWPVDLEKDFKVVMLLVI
ncbi:hypothetical protein OESDEN_18917 [Oesophagostomum dentatum]|uniref:Uncharacterized protein n=1 Tax=Oesophagostomum dentatum TaxID=61180 RepID=A0A0B1SCX0_OESDE|nr:hypothetical protein OESDEN_18917 [Oesophagostomum dentatum]